MEHEWTDGIMLHGWPECGPGTITIGELYDMFKARMELEKHKEDCWLRAWPAGDKCTCGLQDQPTGDV